MPINQSAGMSVNRLSLTPNPDVRYQYITMQGDGTMHVIIESLDFIDRPGKG